MKHSLFLNALLILLSGCVNGPSHIESPTQDETALLPKLSVQQVQALFPSTVGQQKPLIVDFSSKFCMACQQIAPKLDKVIEAHPALTLQYIDIAHIKPQDKDKVRLLNVTTAPQVFFITGQGRIVAQFMDDTPFKVLNAAAQKIDSGSAQQP